MATAPAERDGRGMAPKDLTGVRRRFLAALIGSAALVVGAIAVLESML